MQNVFNANTFNTNGAGIFNLAPATNACRTCHKERGQGWYRVLGNWLKRQPKATLSTLARRVGAGAGAGAGEQATRATRGESTPQNMSNVTCPHP